MSGLSTKTSGSMDKAMKICQLSIKTHLFMDKFTRKGL